MAQGLGGLWLFVQLVGALILFEVSRNMNSKLAKANPKPRQGSCEGI